MIPIQSGNIDEAAQKFRQVVEKMTGKSVVVGWAVVDENDEEGDGNLLLPDEIDLDVILQILFSWTCVVKESMDDGY